MYSIFLNECIAIRYTCHSQVYLIAITCAFIRVPKPRDKVYLSQKTIGTFKIWLFSKFDHSF